MRSLANDLRMIVVIWLVRGIMWALPDTDEGKWWVQALNEATIKSLKNIEPIAHAKGWTR